MRILSVLTYYAPHWTGLTGYAQRLAEGLVRHGHVVTVLTHRHHPQLAAAEDVNGVRVVRVDPIARISRGMLSPGFSSTASQLIGTHDAVHIHTPMLESHLVARLCQRALRPLVMVHHGDLIMPAGLGNRLVQRSVVAMMLRAGKLAAAVVAYSRDYAQHSDFLQAFGPKLTYIWPPIDIPAPDEAAVRSWRGELGLTDKKLVGFAGRFVEEKGFDYLLQALPALRASEPTAHLVYAGEHQVVYERFYERCRPLLEMHQHHVSFVGLQLDRQRMANFYRMCDVLAHPSRTDCFGVVQVEAMLSGTPVVASNIPGARAPVRLSGMGRLCAPRDPAALATAIQEVLATPAAFRQPRATIARLFDAEQAIDAHIALLDSLRGGVPRPRPVPSRGVRPAAPGSLGSVDRQSLTRALGRELDMAYRRRALALVDYLELQPGDRVLDGGCGQGFYLTAMRQLKPLRLVGLDRHAHRLAQAHRRHVPAELVAGRLDGLPFPSASFDKILLSEVLEHVADDALALAEARRVLRPGGILAVSVPHANFPFWWDPINRVNRALGGEPIRSGPLVGIWTDHVRLYWPDDLAARLREAGFAIDHLEEATHYTLPFSHFLLYGIGKPLLERHLLPAALHASADRFGTPGAADGRFNVVRVARAVFRAVDRLNERRGHSHHTFVNVLVKARRA